MKAERLVDVNGNPISAQAAYDAAMSGLVYIQAPKDGTPSDNSALVAVMAVETTKIDEEIVTTTLYTTEAAFYAGKEPIS